MRIFVVKARCIWLSAIALILVIAALAFSVYILSADSISIFNTDKGLPIYSVDVPGKKSAITFDCDWEEVDKDTKGKLSTACMQDYGLWEISV